MHVCFHNIYFGQFVCVEKSQKDEHEQWLTCTRNSGMQVCLFSNRL